MFNATERGFYFHSTRVTLALMCFTPKPWCGRFDVVKHSQGGQLGHVSLCPNACWGGGGLRSQGIDAGFIWWILSLESPSVAITAVIHFLLLFLLLFPGNVSSQAPILFTVVTKKSNNLESQYSGNCRKRLNPADRKEGNPASRTEWNTDDFSLGITKPPAKWASDLSNKSSQMSPFCGGFWVFKEGYGGIEAAGDKCHPVNC